MKSQIKNDLLKFNKSTMVELNDAQLRDTDSGTTPFCIGPIIVITIITATMN